MEKSFALRTGTPPLSVIDYEILELIGENIYDEEEKLINKLIHSDNSKKDYSIFKKIIVYQNNTDKKRLTHKFMKETRI